jgi:hypothetical protein
MSCLKVEWRLSVGGLNKAQRQGCELPCAAGDGNSWLLQDGNHNLSCPGSAVLRSFGRTTTPSLKPFKESTAFFMFQLPLAASIPGIRRWSGITL